MASPGANKLTHWGRVTHICVSKLTIIGSDNGLAPDRRQAIIWTNAGILLIEPLGTNVSETLIEIHTFSSKKMHLKMSSGKWRQFCLCLNVLIWLSRERKQCSLWGYWEMAKSKLTSEDENKHYEPVNFKLYQHPPSPTGLLSMA